MAAASRRVLRLVILVPRVRCVHGPTLGGAGRHVSVTGSTVDQDALGRKGGPFLDAGPGATCDDGGMPVQRPGARPAPFHDDAPRAGIRAHGDEDIAPVLLTPFDVTAYTHSAAGRISLDLEAITAEASRLPRHEALEIARILRYLGAVESRALTEVRAMYASWTANEARITAFIATWLYERHWTAQALGELAACFGAEDLPPTHQPGSPLARLRRAYVKRLQPIMGPLWSIALGERVTAGHMTRMASQEAQILAAIRAIMARVAALPLAHRALADLGDRHARSARFFVLEALARTRRSRGEAVTASLVLRLGGTPMRPAGLHMPDEAAMSVLDAPQASMAVHPHPSPASSPSRERHVPDDHALAPRRTSGSIHGLRS